MLTFRYFIAAGMGAAIALSHLEATLAQSHPSSNASGAQGERIRENLPIPKTGDDRPGDHFHLVQVDEGEPARPDNFLDPNGNPLQFPTVPEEVEIIETYPIALEEAIAQALRNNRQLEETRLTLERSQSQLREAKADLYPTLSVRSNLVRTNQNGTREVNNDEFSQDVNTTSLDGTVELNYNLFSSGRRSAQINAAESQVRLNELEVERVESQLRFDVTDAYYNLQQADEDVRIAKSSVESSQKSLEDAQALERAGVGTRFDVLRAEVQLANAKQDLNQAISQQQINRRQIAQLLSLPQSLNIVTGDPVEPAGDWSLSLEQSIVLAYKNRSELEQQLVQREISDFQRSAARANLGPQVDLFGNYQYSWVNQSGEVLLATSGDSTTRQGSLAFGARLQWNLYDGGASSARATQQERNIEIAETRFANQRNQVRFEVEQAFYNLEFNRTNIDTAQVALDQAKESLRLARLRFQAGVGTQTDVLDADTELTRAEANLVRAIIGYNRSLASMERAITNLDDGTLN
jgi:OMF family outer membrane factor